MIILATAILILTVFLLSNKRYRLIYIIIKTLPRDLSGGYRFFKLLANIFLCTKRGESVPKIFSKLAKKHPHKVAFYYEDEVWTFQQLEEFSNQIAHYFKSKGYRKEDTVALLLENRPEFVGIWLGLSKIGMVTALINTNLMSDPLIHSLSAVNIKAFIYGSAFSKTVSDIEESISDLELFEFGDNGTALPGSANLKLELKLQPVAVPDELAETKMTDKLIYIYTSGTTGLPKAAVVLNSRYVLGAGAPYYLPKLSPDDIVYNPLPLYHSAGGMLAAGLTVVFGVSVVLRKKFSASNFWTDCQKYNCTVANYIGETCRYLLTVHKPGTEVNHSVRTMYGNGLRPQIWERFQKTFKIKNIIEFYGATEGNSQLVNTDGKIGAVGFVPRVANFVFSSILIKCDKDTGEPIRNKDGLCTKCDFGEPGLFVGKVDQKRVYNAFVGYADEKATQKKILRDVIVKGDMYFNTGDMLVQDEFGYFYFKDRTGDTFRWKGENVATNEIEAVISSVLDLRDVISYGVEVPGTEGRAGMVAIVDPEKTLDLKKLATQLKAKLPGYAIPVFLRIIDTVPITGTYKLKKVDLQKGGFDIEQIKNGRVYFFDSTISEYVPLTKELFIDITNCGRSL